MMGLEFDPTKDRFNSLNEVNVKYGGYWLPGKRLIVPVFPDPQRTPPTDFSKSPTNLEFPKVLFELRRFSEKGEYYFRFVRV